MQSNDNCASNVEAFYNEDIVKKYFQVVHDASYWCDYRSQREYAKQYPEAFKHFSAVHRKRTSIHHSLDAMKCTGNKVYFGTLTYKNSKNKNKRETKLKEAFKKLNTIFKYVLIVEEYGEINDRYHIHFLGVFKYDHTFDSFKKLWHSRQNLEEVGGDDVAKYLCKYVVKDLPRLRRNKNLSSLTKIYLENKKAMSKGQLLMQTHKTFPDSLAEKVVQTIDAFYQLDFDIESPF